MRKYIAELIGTFLLVVAGPGAVAMELPHSWISIAFGVIVTLMIICFGKISGAHINPAVSLAFYLSEKEKDYLIYIPFQLLGGLMGGILLFFLLPANEVYGETLPRGSWWEAFIIEVAITFALMLSIFLIVRTKKLLLVAVVVGLVVFLAAFFAGPLTGASMNPARSLGPNVVSGHTSVLWLYFIAPSIGAIGAHFVNEWIKHVTN